MSAANYLRILEAAAVNEQIHNIQSMATVTTGSKVEDTRDGEICIVQAVTDLGAIRARSMLDGFTHTIKPVDFHNWTVLS